MRSPTFRRCLLECALVLAAITLPGCAPEGAGSVHIDRSAVNKVMVLPDRKSAGPSRPPTRREQSNPKVRNFQR
jgi:hypothetical protein